MSKPRIIRAIPGSTDHLGKAWGAKVEVLAPSEPDVPYRSIDAIDRHGGGLDQEQRYSLRAYLDARIAQKNRSCILAGYEPRVDDNWDDDPEVDKEAASLIDRVHAKLGLEMRAIVDALVDAVETREMPCPFARSVARYRRQQIPASMIGIIAGIVLAAK